MKPKVLFSLLMLVQLIASCPCLGDDGSARRYALLRGDDELLLTICLLDRRDVQSELKLTAKQVATIEHACSAKAQDIPGLMELLADLKKRRSDPSLSASDKEKVGKAASAHMKSLCEEYQRRELSATLSANQRQRLDELLTQMAGPIAVLDNRAILSKLQLSEKQRVEMADTAKHYEAGLGWLRARYGRQQISGLSTSESLRDREKEVEALFVVIRAIEKERDADLLMELTPSQVASWRKLQGHPFPIGWPPTSISGCDCE